MNNRPNLVINMLGFHTGEKPKIPCLIMSRLFSVHESGTGYCWGFEIDTREHTIADLMNAVALQVPNMDGARTFAVYRERNSVDNCVMIHKAGHYVYGSLAWKSNLIILTTI